MNVPIRQGQDIRPGGSVTDVGVGGVVLLGLHIDVRQRCLGDLGYNASHVRKRVGDRAVDYNVASRNRFRTIDDSQASVGLPGCQCGVADAGE